MPDILVTARDHVGVVSLNRPEVRNAVTLSMWPTFFEKEFAQALGWTERLLRVAH